MDKAQCPQGMDAESGRLERVGRSPSRPYIHHICEGEWMITRIRRWGNSLCLRISKFLAEEVHVRAGGTVDLELGRGRPVVRPRVRGSCSLEHLLTGITQDNVHGEIPTGERVGREAW